MTNKVLIGKVKNELQLKVNLEEKFYHIPEAVMPKNILPVGYVALFYEQVHKKWTIEKRDLLW